MKILIRSSRKEQEIPFQPGETVFDVMLRSDVPPNSYCGGKGTCGKCRVRWVQKDQEFLACQLPAEDGMLIDTVTENEIQILAQSLEKAFVLNPVVPSDLGGLGVAVDLGTTTMVGYLLDLESGQELTVASLANPQRVFGADVISRIAYTQSNPGGAGKLQEVLVTALNAMVADLCRKSQRCTYDVGAMTIAGNTVMLHTLLGVSAVSIANAPFEPVFSDQRLLSPQELGLAINPHGQIIILPSVSGYVGADIVAGLLVCDLEEQDSYGLLIDIGTNGEIVLGKKGKMLACSTAAGPAFEGANISMGMAGVQGALSSFRLHQGERVYETIGGITPQGICGSGLMDIMAELLRHGFVDSSGAFARDELAQWQKEMLTAVEGMPAFMAVPDLISFTQRDVRQVQLAKGALRAGVLTLLKEAQITAQEVGRVYLAGGFGNFVDVHNACTLGLIPAELEERVVKIGNGAGLGAKLALLDQDQLDRATSLKKQIRYIELSTRSDFQELFMEAMFF